MARKAGKGRAAAPSSHPRRPVLGNDPFQRGAAVRTAPVPQSEPVPPAPPPAAQARPGQVDQAPEPAARLERLDARAEEALGSAEARLAELARRTGPLTYAEELRELLLRLLPALRESLKPLASLARLFAAPGGLDAFGMDARLWEAARPLLDFLFETWWRVDVRGVGAIPPGPALLVANRGGSLPWDALVLRLAAARHPLNRELRPLLDAPDLSVPVSGALAVRLGAVRATPENAHALLSDGSLVAVFPEGHQAASRPWGERYRIQRFGRGGFVRVAARAQVPIVPCAVVGSEEASAPFGRQGWLAEVLGLPLLSLAPGLPSAPVGWVPLPSRWSIRFGQPVQPPPPASADDPAAVGAVAEGVRATLQRLLDAEVAARRSVFL
ncbi:MAG TPA: lysophospholipid acyltransferase family protein [Anaeromyxobacteraceae bacterium]|nr:lysophospholipid acyltransferase family protein [Anaeromyxobacteraceae bacterium]